MGELKEWLKQDWERIGTDGKIKGKCGTSKDKKNPDRCLPRAKAQSLSQKERASTARKKKKEGKKGKTNQWFAMVIMEGRTREVRRLWESQNLQVSRLKRVRYGDLFLPANLKQGSYKELSKSEVKVIEHL